MHRANCRGKVMKSSFLENHLSRLVNLIWINLYALILLIGITFTRSSPTFLSVALPISTPRILLPAPIFTCNFLSFYSNLPPFYSSYFYSQLLFIFTPSSQKFLLRALPPIFTRSSTTFLHADFPTFTPSILFTAPAFLLVAPHHLYSQLPHFYSHHLNSQLQLFLLPHFYSQPPIICTRTASNLMDASLPNSQ